MTPPCRRAPDQPESSARPATHAACAPPLSASLRTPVIRSCLVAAFDADAGPAEGGNACPPPPLSGRQCALFLVGRVRAVGRRACARRAHEQLLAIRERHVAAVGLAGRTAEFVLGLIAADDDLGAGLQRVAVDARAQQGVGRAPFHHPGGRGAIGTDGGDMDPGVRVDPFHPGYLAAQQHWGFAVKFGGKRVVRHRLLDADGAGRQQGYASKSW